MSKRRLSLTGPAEEGGAGAAGAKLARQAGAREEALLAGLEEAWAAAARAQVEGTRGAPDARVALARYLDGMRTSLFATLRASRASAAAAGAAAGAGAGAGGGAEPLDRELALEVARLEKAVEKLGRTVKEARESVRGWRGAAAPRPRAASRQAPARPSTTSHSSNALYAHMHTHARTPHCAP
jgi:hypothetical protein